MDRDQFVAARAPRWAELDELTARGAGLRRDPRRIRRLAELLRAAVADLAIARRRFPGDPLLEPLTRRVVTARHCLAGLGRERLGIRAFLATGYWQRVRERPRLLLVALAFLMVPFVLAAFWAVQEPAKARGLAPAGVESVTSRDRADFGLSAGEKAEVSAAIFTNNIRVTFLAFALGMVAGVGALLLLGYQGVVLGATFGLTIHVGNADALFEFVFPHGVLELSCIVVAGAAGMRMGWALVAPGYRTRAEALRAEARGAVAMIVGTALVLVGCGIVEGAFSTSGVPLPVGVAVGVALGGSFWAAIVLRGRRAAGPVEPGDPVVDAARPRGITAPIATSP